MPEADPGFRRGLPGGERRPVNRRGKAPATTRRTPYGLPDRCVERGNHAGHVLRPKHQAGGLLAGDPYRSASHASHAARWKRRSFLPICKQGKPCFKKTSSPRREMPQCAASCFAVIKFDSFVIIHPFPLGSEPLKSGNAG